ncbi:MAG: aminopeptidase P N-terminal domain-containing protein [Chloroherpetonaceae bacterium]|nr:aminopeptidase P N-terminal domain-containing protein [Chloroherpetonaceae bacterium]
MKKSIFLFSISLCLFVSGVDGQSMQSYNLERLSSEFYKANRDRLRAEMPDSAVAIFFSAELKNRNNDVDYLFRQESNFLYLTGHLEPESVLILSKNSIGFDSLGGERGKEFLFVLPRDPQSETWNGRRLGAEGAVRELQFEHAYINTKLELAMKELISKCGSEVKTVFFAIPKVYNKTDDEVQTKRQKQVVTLFQIDSLSAKVRLRNIVPVLSKLRVEKQPEEIKAITEVTEISALAHKEAMRSCEVGLYEYSLAAAAEFVFKSRGCSYPGYPSIVGSGENATILHYQTTRKRLQNGELIVMDMAGELRGYSSDVTRTIPVSGKFSKEQREIYALVLKAQEAAIKACRKGVSFLEPNRIAMDIMAEGLIKLGIIQNAEQLGQYSLHFISHHVGLDVHDPMSPTFNLNHTFTIEPGIYIPEGSPCDPKWWKIGVRIEDVVLVTDGEPKVLSNQAPKSINAIEKLMREKGIANLQIK